MATVNRSVMTATIEPLGLELEVLDGSIALDESRVPYGNAEVTVALPDSEDLEALTPYEDLRLVITVDQEWVTPARAPQSRTFDLLLHEREVNHQDNTLRLRAETDEALLLDYLLIATAPERTYGLSVKTAVEYALAKVGATLEAGAADANLEDQSVATVTNLMPNPSVRSAVGNWVAGGNNGTLTRQTGLTGGPVDGVTTYTRTTWSGASGAGNGGVWCQAATISPYATVSASATYRVSLWARSNVLKAVRLLSQEYTSGGALVDGGRLITSLTLTPNVWTRISGTFTTNSTTGRVAPYLYADTSTQWGSGNTLDTLGWMITEGTTEVDSFDGTTTDTSLDVYAWTGTANASSSTKDNQPQNSATIWEPGTSADSFLDPLLQATGLRLFADEQRRWYLVEDSGFTVDGTVTVSEGFNATSGTDLMSRQRSEDGRPLWFDSVVVEYRSQDQTGKTVSSYDIAGAPGTKGFKVTYDRPYPGPGAAAAILARAQGRGRVQDLQALADYLATPGMTLLSTMPGTPIQTGVVSSVTWLWSAEGDTDVMSIGSRGLTETPATAWILDAPGDSWDDIAPGTDWSEDL